MEELVEMVPVGKARKQLKKLCCSSDTSDAWKQLEAFCEKKELNMEDKDIFYFAPLPHFVGNPPKGLCQWRIAARLPLFYCDDDVKEVVDANLWIRWPEEEMRLWDDDEFVFRNLERNTEKRPKRPLKDVECRVVESEEDVNNVMIVLRAKFGINGEKWHLPEEICEEFVRKGLFVVAMGEDGPVGCCGATKLKDNLYDVTVKIGSKTYATRPGYELTHYAVLGIGGKSVHYANEIEMD